MEICSLKSHVALLAHSQRDTLWHAIFTLPEFFRGARAVIATWPCGSTLLTRKSEFPRALWPYSALLAGSPCGDGRASPISRSLARARPSSSSLILSPSSGNPLFLAPPAPQLESMATEMVSLEASWSTRCSYFSLCSSISFLVFLYA